MNRDRRIVTSRGVLASLWLVAILLAAGCARSPGVGVAGDGGHRLLQPTTEVDQSADLEEPEDWDPFQPFNERMFAFNHDILDRWLIRPVATGWSKIMPEVARRGFGRMLHNVEMPQRLVNNLLQGRPLGAGRELARFTVNTTVGLAGAIDVASKLDIEPSEADSGQTLAMYGVGPGPFLVLPTFPPLTVRDAIGRGIDGAMDPIGYILPFFANRVKSIVTAINERSLNLKLFADVEDSVLDLYSAARNGYLQRRRRVVESALASRHEEWRWAFRTPPTVTAHTRSSEDPA